ncbi:GDP-mannose 4,6-dehydratase [Endozoicomonas gorgoniicola]|uniref:GDP-mannose 4,6-dehydratase n=1 Tax=Endozoicomonas gorgoniicola TaxID=1234144 RepID=A0ABT3MS46_9GAMM|nr:GDP-mannose 4,6-dehydratase [Endozoicomonas gorgoniicola]MCW7552202.1 GDP-mannose 4,6-dehydratase [Endozoicomonas gorgoniicola]
MRTALITGITGFTGSYLAAELSAAGFDVYGTSFRKNKALDNKIFNVDLCDIDTLRDLIVKVSPDVVVHLAAVSFVDHKNKEEIYRTNIIGTHNLLTSLSENKKKPDSVLLASSANVYGDNSLGEIIESTQPSPINDYAVSKLAMEYMAKLWLDKLPIFIVRPFNYTGIGQSSQFLISKIVEHYRKGDEEIELGNIDISRDFLDVRTVAEYYRRLIEMAPVGETINVCSGKSISIREILKIMDDITGYKIKVNTNSSLIRRKDIKCLCGSNKYLNELVGDHQKISLHETLHWMYQGK